MMRHGLHSPSHPRHFRRRGFTLIEALAAIAVMVIIIPVTLQGISLGAKIARDARQHAEATLIAQAKLDEIVATQSWQSGTISGQERMGVTDYLWDASLDTYDSDQSMQTLTVQVEWQSGSSTLHVALVTIVYTPGSVSVNNGVTTDVNGDAILNGGLP